MKKNFIFILLTLLVVPALAQAAPVIFSVAGDNPAAITPTVNSFRSALGDNNGGGPFSPPLTTGRREINWDGVPDAASSPNPFPGDFFNQTTAGRARGALFSTPGTGFQVSADSSNPTSSPVEFGNIDPTYTNIFQVFSPQRLFTPIDSNITDVTFFVPGQPALAATTIGFGAIFTDIDLPTSTAMEFFDSANNSLGVFAVPALAGSENLSFLGVFFDDPIVDRVRITSGNTALGSGILDDGHNDLVVMDDFIYGEPQVVPLPGALLLFGSGLVSLTAGRCWRRKFTS